MASTEVTALDSLELTWGVVVDGLRTSRIGAPDGLEN